MTRNKIVVSTIFYILWLLIVGCALPDPVATRQEFIEAQRKVYTEVTKGQIIDAAKQVFLLADPDDIQFVYASDRLIAYRRGITYFIVFSTHDERWTIETMNVDKGVFVTALVEPKTDGGSYSPEGIGPYMLFYNRLDYLLGQSETWMTCEDYTKIAETHSTWGEDQFLCYHADDTLPEALRPVETGENRSLPYP